MTQLPDFAPAAPEIFLLTMACLILLVDLFLDEARRDVTFFMVQTTLLGGLLLTLLGAGEEQVTFYGSYVADPLSTLLKSFLYLITFAVFLYSRHFLKQRGLYQGEYFLLGLFGLLGMLIMASAGSLLTLYLGLELLALSSYALVAFDRDSPIGSEAAMKYFVLGALASGMLLYGLSMIYGVTGSLDIATVAERLPELEESRIAIAFGIAFIVIGVGFKLGVVPFHMWVPDVYEGAPTPVTLYLSAAPKIAALALMLRLLMDGLESLLTDWRDMLVILAALSVVIGNLVAIAQHNIKRMLAYSTISHMGFLIMGVLAGTEAGYAAAIFYAITYALMSAGAFGLLLLLAQKGWEVSSIEDLKGLSQHSPWFALMMLILMFSMAGVPPTVGFYAKLLVLQAVVSVDLVWLAILGVIFSVVGAFYYLRIIKLIYFDAPGRMLIPVADRNVQLLLSANALSLLLLGLFPTTLLSYCFAAAAG